MRTEQTEQLTLLSLQRELALATDIDVVLRRIAEAATTLLGAERTTVYVVDHQRAEVWSRVLTESELREIRLPLDGQGLASEVARNGEVLRVEARTATRGSMPASTRAPGTAPDRCSSRRSTRGTAPGLGCSRR